MHKETIDANLVHVRGRVFEVCSENRRHMNEITLVAVTKTVAVDAIQIAIAHGIHEIGESRVQEMETKIDQLKNKARLHMIGHLQSNKVKKAVQLFDVIQSVDSIDLANEINRRAGELSRHIECLIEINSSGESQKHGVAPEQAIELIEKVHVLPNISLSGLMTIGPLSNNEKNIREAFQRTRELFEAGGVIVGKTFRTLSMGMSGDYEIAVAEGSTMLRLGSAIFGSRS